MARSAGSVWIPVVTGMTTFRLAPKLREHRRSPRQPLDERAQELPIEAQLTSLRQALEVSGLDLEELHFRHGDDRSRAARAIARKVGHLAEAVAFLEDVQELSVLDHFHLPADDDEEGLPDLAL